MRNRKALWIVQAVILAAVAWFVWRSLHDNWKDLTSIDIEISPGWIVAALGTIWLSYALLIEAWRRVLLGWKQHVGFRSAAGIWCLSNLGRYLPGKVWSIAGLSVLAERQGVSGWAALGSAFVMQALALGTGAAVVFSLLPGTSSPLQLALALLVSAALVLFLTWERGVKLLAKVAGRAGGGSGGDPAVLPLGAALSGAATTAASWILYGIAFWFLARGILPNGGDLPLGVSIGVFAAGYITGLLALVVPGGVGVREAMFLTLLAPYIGAGPAAALSIASRLLMTTAEVLAALTGIRTVRRGEEIERF